MCGICGVYNFGTREPVARRLLKRSTDAMAHRGPDDEGFHVDGDCGLGNRRLSIIDLAGGHQPIANEDATIWITFNGEVYNYRELRPGLESRGHRFRTSSDTEAIVHLYEDYDLGAIDHLRGMFAFALWDSRRRRLLIARDRLGIKPLFYRLEPGRVVFASELRALGGLTTQPFEIDPQSVYDFFGFRYVPAPRTFYRGVEKLLPGHLLLADSKGVTISSYWDVPGNEATSRSTDEWSEAVIETLRESVRLRLIADVPLGVFLSGGVDSSAVVAFMSELGHRPLRSFSIGFDEPGYSELPYARQVAKQFSTDHHELVVKPEDLASDLPHLIAFRNEPIAEPTDIALYRISRLAAQSVKVVLAGEGGDELFAGYSKYAFDHWAGRVSRLPRGFLRTLSRSMPFGQHRAQTALEKLSIRDEAARFATWFASFSGSELSSLFALEFLKQVDTSHPARVFADILEKVRDRSPLKRMLYADLKVWLPDNLLLRGDQMTMAASLEERVPFLDHKLVELAASIPDRLLVRGFRTKVLLKKALASHLPAGILHRRKVGFTVPVGPWFRGPLKSFVSDLLLSSNSAAHDYFNRAHVERIVRDHIHGVRNYQKHLWALVNFDLWKKGVGSGE